MNRTQLITGPAKGTFRSATMFSKEDIMANVINDTFDVVTSAHGKVDERNMDVRVDADFTPEGRWDATLIAAIWADYANMVLGTSMLSATDRPFVLSAADGEVHTIHAATITKLPDLILSATKTLVGQMTVSGLRAKDAEWSATSNNLYTIAASGGSLTDATFSPAGIPTQHYTAAWGAKTGFTAIETMDGWTISFDLQYETMSPDRLGPIDFRFKGLSVMAKCVPIGPSATQILAELGVQGTGARRGRSLSGNSADLTITGADAINYAVIKGAALKTAGYRFGATVLRNNEIGFVATRQFSSGAQQPLFVLAAS